MFRRLLLVAALGLCGVGCSDDPPMIRHPYAINVGGASNPPAPAENPVTTALADGVYYFGVNKGDFGVSLAAFKRAHPELVVTAIGVDDTGGYGRTVGYFVSTEPRQACKCEEK